MTAILLLVLGQVPANHVDCGGHSLPAVFNVRIPQMPAGLPSGVITVRFVNMADSDGDGQVDLLGPATDGNRFIPPFVTEGEGLSQQIVGTANPAYDPFDELVPVNRASIFHYGWARQMGSVTITAGKEDAARVRIVYSDNGRMVAQWIGTPDARLADPWRAVRCLPYVGTAGIGRAEFNW